MLFTLQNPTLDPKIENLKSSRTFMLPPTFLQKEPYKVCDQVAQTDRLEHLLQQFLVHHTTSFGLHF